MWTKDLKSKEAFPSTPIPVVGVPQPKYLDGRISNAPAGTWGGARLDSVSILHRPSCTFWVELAGGVDTAL